MGFATKSEVTYQAFGIDPADFYATRFSGRSDFNPALLSETAQKRLEWEKYTILEEVVRSELDGHNSTITMLDVGSGSGLFGKWLKYKFPDRLHITGIDMSESCVANVINGVYDEAFFHNFTTGMPFGEGQFDFVWSMDVFGHIEFRHKEAVVRELARITRRGGRQLHGIETAEIPYLTCNSADVNDPVRKYVQIDGHIGVESLDDVADRFIEHFVLLEAYPWLIRPFVSASNAIKAWPEYSAALRSVDTAEARQFHDIVAHYQNRFFRQSLRAAFGPVQTAAYLRQVVGDTPMLTFLLSIAEGGGFSFLLVEKA